MKMCGQPGQFTRENGPRYAFNKRIDEFQRRFGHFMEQKDPWPLLYSKPEPPSLYKFNSFSLLFHLSNLPFRKVILNHPYSHPVSDGVSTISIHPHVLNSVVNVIALLYIKSLNDDRVLLNHFLWWLLWGATLDRSSCNYVYILEHNPRGGVIEPFACYN